MSSDRAGMEDSSASRGAGLGGAGGFSDGGLIEPVDITGIGDGESSYIAQFPGRCESGGLTSRYLICLIRSGDPSSAGRTVLEGVGS